jgi:hypothetical protein
MNNRFRHLIAPVAVLALLALVPSAGASSTGVLRACLNEQSLDGYSDADKRAALNQLAADQDEYSDCRSVIGASIGTKKVTASASSNTPSGSAQASDPGKVRKVAATKRRQARKSQQARSKRARQKAREQTLGRRAIDPRDPGVFKAAGTANGMPLPVVLALIAVGLLALTGGTLAVSRRNPRVAGVLRRVSLPRFRR